MEVYYVPAIYSRLLLLTAENEGLSPETLLQGGGLDSEALSNPFGSIPFRVHEQMLLDASSRLGDPAFGMKMGRRMTRLDHFDILGYAVISNRTLEEALALGIRNLADFRGPIAIQRESRDEQACYVFSPLLPPRPGLTLHLEFLMSHGLTTLRSVIGPEYHPLEVHLQHAPLGPMEEYAKTFGQVPRFSQTENCMVIPIAWLDMPCKTANPPLSEALSKHMTRLLGSLPTATRLRDVVRSEIAEALSSGRVGLKEIARRLKLKPRTLQHQLHAEETRFQELLEEVRREKAFKALSQPQGSIADIADRLGFSDSRAFDRAFRRWSGQTPREYRRQRGL